MENLKLALKESFLIVLKILRAPIKELKSKQQLSWKNILVIYSITIFLSSFITNILAGNILLSIPKAVSSLVDTAIIHSIILGLIYFALFYVKQKQIFIKLCESWVLAYIPATAVSIILSFNLWLSFLASLVFILFFYYRLLNIEVLKKTALIICGVLLIIYIAIFYKSVVVMKDIRSLQSEFIDGVYGISKEMKEKIKEYKGYKSEPSSVELPPTVYEYAEKYYLNEPKKKAAFLQNAKSLNAIANSSYDRETLIEIDDRATACLSFVFEGLSSDTTIKMLESLIFNTATKIKAYIEWNKSFSGTILGDKGYTIDEACDE